MRRTPWATYFWPGLPQLWLEGAWSGLALALVAAALVDVLLLSTLVWVELFDPVFVKLGWLAAGGLWIGAAIRASRIRRSFSDDTESHTVEDLFRKAQSEYLQGDYFQAEATLADLLERNPRDAAARLMLATMFRHTRRYPEADEQLKQLTRFESAAYWQIEISGERTRLKRLRKDQRLQAQNDARTNTSDEHLTTHLQLPSTTQAA